MKKYIRTKDGVYEIDILSFNDLGRNRFTCWELGHMRMFEDWEIIKQADTIEELCDEFVLHYNDTIQTSIPIPWATYERRGDNWQKHKEKLISELKKIERKAIVYGAIWTYSGLIYVAKMNEEGKFELLYYLNKALEALEIILKKKVDMYFIDICENAKCYNRFFDFDENRLLEEYEFILLKDHRKTLALTKEELS